MTLNKKLIRYHEDANERMITLSISILKESFFPYVMSLSLYIKNSCGLVLFWLALVVSIYDIMISLSLFYSCVINCTLYALIHMFFVA